MRSAGVAISRHGVSVRLTAERWAHIVEGHCEMAGRFRDVLETIEDADEIHQGSRGERIAMRKMSERKWMVVYYREVDAGDGFVITAHMTSRPKSIRKRPQTWP